MKVFTCTDHDSIYPVGCCSIVVAPTEELARQLLQVELDSRRLGGRDFTLQEVDLTLSRATVLLDGSY